MSLDAMKQALEALEEIADEVFSPYDNKLGDAILALRAAIEQPREWQGLTDDEREQFRRWAHPDMIEAIELRLQERNT
jgi:hypothetical protein